MVISITLGTGLYFNGFSERLENVFSEKIPYYNRLVYSCEEQWMKPERGLLAGTIIEIGLTDNNFKAMEIRPWQQGQGRFMMGGNR